MKATILNIETGETATVDGPRSSQWAEGNWSCDCNRNAFHAPEEGPENICKGARRFVVIAATFDDPEDEPFTLEELNADYPPDVVAWAI